MTSMCGPRTSIATFPTPAPRRCGLGTLLAATIVVATACAPESPAEFRIGLLAIYGGGYSESSGDPSIRGAEMAAAEINAAGGITADGRRHSVEIVIRRYAARGDDAATRARGLLNQDSVHALVGPQISAHAIPVSVIAERVGVPMISPLSTNPETTAGKKYVFRLAFLDDVQGRVMAHFAYDSLGARSAAVLYDEAVAYGRDLAARFASAFSAAGGLVVAEERYTTDRTATFEAQLRRIARADPDVLFLPNPADQDSIQMRQARDLGIRARFLGSDMWDLQLLSEVPASEGALITHHWHFQTPTPEVAAFLDSFRARYDHVPRATAAMTYDAVHIIARAAAATGTVDAAAVRDAIATMSDYRGATGTISFHGSGDPVRSVVLSTLVDGQIVVKHVIDP